MTYIIISLLMLIPFFFLVKRFLLSNHVHHNVSGIMLTVVAIAVHMYIFRFDRVPIVSVSIPNIVAYGSIVIALLHGMIYSVCFRLYFGRGSYDDHSRSD
ncbi:hypothetical protein [Xenorhabdus bovienii]|uniref:hypothetical protein n=1 Tax=Xenorhabdus bovienii TaxID=40576 RepID=UPI0023B2EA9F|nr:hypothetical protein [Xenorhabdus bovienii]MDE9432503.1 hypothetical protein [Xenorhabdus bovienii]MDE9489988.1 hypothetical protein [Xenorhabdus bovienii]MDE9506303.1 hypothetical protein [Xenorhabdus bovienii]MDE9547125.1 hypothetical protein [Xenorhabdus bovienii]